MRLKNSEDGGGNIKGRTEVVEGWRVPLQRRNKTIEHLASIAGTTHAHMHTCTHTQLNVVGGIIPLSFKNILSLLMGG